MCGRVLLLFPRCPVRTQGAAENRPASEVGTFKCAEATFARKQSRAHCLSQLNQLNLTSAKSCVWGDCMKITAGERLGWPTDLLDPVSG